MAHIFECAIFQHNIFQGDCGAPTPIPTPTPRPGGGNLSARIGFIRRRHRLTCEWEALKAAQDAARKLQRRKYARKLAEANAIAAKALHEAELCRVREDEYELNELRKALELAVHARRATDVLSAAMQIEHKAELFRSYLLGIEEEEESIVALFL